MLWNAACRYHWGGLKTPAEADAEEQQIKESREKQSQETAGGQETSDSAALKQGTGESKVEWIERQTRKQNHAETVPISRQENKKNLGKSRSSYCIRLMEKQQKAA